MLPDQVSPMKKSINELVNAMRYVELKNRGIYLRKKLIMRVYEMLEKDDVYGLPVLPSDDYVCSMESLRRFNHYRMMPVDSIWTEKARFAGEDERLHSMAEHIIQKHKETCSRTERNLNRRMKKISHLLLSLKQEGKTPDLEIEGLLREIEINDANLEDMVDVFEDISTIDYDKNNSIGLDNPTEPK